MGHPNHLAFVTRNLSEFQGPVLEIGSKNYGNTENLRGLLSEESYIGVDMIDGDGVDLILDLTLPFDQVDAALEGRRFKSIFCLSVLEHCTQPFAMASNMTRLLEDEGRLYVSVPFSFKFHGFPSDYWRFTHEGVKCLFPDLDWDHPANCSTTPDSAKTMPLGKELGRIKKRILRLITGHRYLMMPTMVEMIGVKRWSST